VTIKANPRRYSEVLGLGVHRATRVVPNSEIIGPIDSSDEWIQERTGIKQRLWAPEGVDIIDMASDAATKALANAGISADRIGTVIVSTISHPYQTPSAAVLVAARIGATNAGAFDISAACAGFSYAVGLADGIISTGQSDHVLVIGVEKLSSWTDPTDRGTAFIFADGAGAFVMGPAAEPGVGPTVWGADGTEFNAIVVEPNWLDLRKQLQETGEFRWPTLHMEGQKVFKWAVGSMVDVCHQALRAAGVTPDDIQLFVPHQANNRITDALVRGLKFPETVIVARDIVMTGNTSAASIPLALDGLVTDGLAKTGDLALMVGFGAGLAYAAQVVRIP